jgi:hypothetical protein
MDAHRLFQSTTYVHLGKVDTTRGLSHRPSIHESTSAEILLRLRKMRLFSLSIHGKALFVGGRDNSDTVSHYWKFSNQVL